MEVLHLTEADVDQLLTMDDALRITEDVLRDQASGAAFNLSRSRVPGQGGKLHLMAGGASGMLGYKAYTTFPAAGGVKFLVLLYDAQNGALEAVIEADRLGQLRTGAATGVATKFMARPDARTVGMYGTGLQARTQLAAVAGVRELTRIVAYGRDPDRRAAYCDEMSRELNVEVVPAETPEKAAEGADIVVTVTTSASPVLGGEWLARGTHVNAAGSNSIAKAEIDVEVVRRSGRIAVDSIEQAKLECGDLLAPVEMGVTHWGAIHELAEVVAAQVPGRADAEEITLFESHGLAIEDVALGAEAVRRARESGVGRVLTIW